MFLHWSKITVIVQQRVAFLDAESADNDVSRFADRNAQLSQLAIVSGCTRGGIAIQQRHERIPAQCAFDTRGMLVIAGALKNLEKNKIADQKRLSTGGGFQLGSPWR